METERLSLNEAMGVPPNYQIGVDEKIQIPIRTMKLTIK